MVFHIFTGILCQEDFGEEGKGLKLIFDLRTIIYFWYLAKQPKYVKFKL